jgi:GNAT superfamily N-acetyltransferase
MSGKTNLSEVLTDLKALDAARETHNEERRQAGLHFDPKSFNKSGKRKTVIEELRVARRVGRTPLQSQVQPQPRPRPQAQTQVEADVAPGNIIESHRKQVNPKQLDDLYTSVGWEPRGVDKWNEIIKKSTGVISLKDGSKLVGFGRFVEDGSVCSFYDGVVHPDYRERGLFTRMHNYGLSQAESRGYNRITLVAEPGTEEMYQHIGYTPVTDVMVFNVGDTLGTEVPMQPQAPAETLANKSTAELHQMLGGIAAELMRRQES